MALPTDRGLAVIEDGVGVGQNVSICADVVNGAPRRTYAKHFNVEVIVDPEVAITVNSASRHTTEIVEVFRDDAGIVRVRRPR